MSEEISSFSDSQLSEIYGWPQERCYRLNLVLSPSGNISGTDGTSLSLTNAQDRRLLRIIRKSADVILLGAESVRSEGWFLPPNGRLCILSVRNNLPWKSCPDTSRVAVFPSISSFLHNLRREEKNILCEGGLKTAQEFAFQAGFDEIALSFATSSELPELPDALTGHHNYDLVHSFSDEEHTMTFGFWRRAI